MSTVFENRKEGACGTLLQVLESAIMVENEMYARATAAAASPSLTSSRKREISEASTTEANKKKKKKKQERRGRPPNEAFRAMHYTGSISSTLNLTTYNINDFPRGEVPVYNEVINHPRRARRSDPDGVRKCVMCGRVSIDEGRKPPSTMGFCPMLDVPPPLMSPPLAMTAGHAYNQISGKAYITSIVAPKDQRHDESFDPFYAVIPQQNKDVCRECDRASWIHHATGMVIKWCKGCKRFENILKFQGSFSASKCDSCRERGRIGYFERVSRKKEEEEGQQQNELSEKIHNEPLYKV